MSELDLLREVLQRELQDSEARINARIDGVEAGISVLILDVAELKAAHVVPEVEEIDVPEVVEEIEAEIDPDAEPDADAIPDEVAAEVAEIVEEIDEVEDEMRPERGHLLGRRFFARAE